MKLLKAAIKNHFEESQRGGSIRIATADAKAIAAIHEFLRFQTSDHKTGYPTEVGESFGEPMLSNE